ncbi:MAG: gamma-glutamylcyclotransferase [Chloroflexi bacterium]|nr:gamma-glutamylcyclotransferase [Chloroflexota bacterium]|tara:strand:- start:10075 stop:10785 length:711 start_codon:yes stop_codon:yes gene_type:complete
MDLKREDILEGRVEEVAMEAERLGLFQRMTPEERQQSKREILSILPKGQDVWLFGYGSLMWNPIIHYVERRAGHVFGFHRSYCLRTAMGRGTPEQPGLTLGLERGGSCRGLLFRVSGDIAEDELDFVWNREMISRAYTPRLINAYTDDRTVRAIAFVMNTQHDGYAGRLTIEETADMIAKAHGRLGRCSEYLENTVMHLDELGIGDGPMHRLLERVRARMAELGIDTDTQTDTLGF